jgi:hypothetical protein
MSKQFVTLGGICLSQTHLVFCFCFYKDPHLVYHMILTADCFICLIWKMGSLSIEDAYSFCTPGSIFTEARRHERRRKSKLCIRFCVGCSLAVQIHQT